MSKGESPCRYHGTKERRIKMLFSEKYYRDNWNRFKSESHMNLEEELEHRTRIYKTIDIPEDAKQQVLDIMSKKYAEEIIAKAEAELQETADMINRIENGEATLGYTTQTQENRAMYRLVTQYEFNCIQLDDFRREHA